VDGASSITPAGEKSWAQRPDDDAAPRQVLDLAAACVRQVLAAHRVELDFTPATLPVLDHYLNEARAAVGARPETLPLIAHSAGAYLGEVVRRSHACWWRIDGNDPGAWRLELRDCYLAFYPVQVVHTALTRDQEDPAFSGIEMPPADLEALAARLEALPPVGEDEYFAPSTRVEILDIAVDAVVARRAAEPDGIRQLGPSDYEQPA
jgi:hypothetical protein